MFDWIWRNPLCATITIGAGTVVASEVIWFLFKYGRDKIQYEKSQIHEILIFNELGFNCIADHRDGTKECNNIHCAQRNIDRLKELIGQAKYNIDVAMFSLCSPELMNVLRQALVRRVHVRIILHPRTRALSNNAQILKHLGARIRIVYSKRNMMHHKFCIIDGQQRIAKLWQSKSLKYKPTITYPVVINGSANWTEGSFGGNFENIIISTDKIIVETLETEFERMWKIF